MPIPRVFPVLLGGLLAGLACSLSSPTATPPALPATATLAAQSTAAPTPTAPVVEPTASLAPSATPFPLPMPSGFAVHNADRLIFHDFAGTAQAEIPIPTMIGYDFIHIAGAWPSGDTLPPVVYYSQQDQSAIYVYQTGQSIRLVNVEQFLALQGVPGSPIVAYVTLNYQKNPPETALYLADFNNLGAAAPALTVQDPDGWALRPLAITLDNGQPQGVWYTRFPWGIGGDIVFEPRDRLFYLDLASGTSTEHLGRGLKPWGPSPDQSWIAYTGAVEQPLAVAALANGGEAVSLPLLPKSDRGAGNAVFAPDNLHLAWMEGSGWLMADVPTFHTIVRLASRDGQNVVNLEWADLADVAGLAVVSWAQPLGWLDNNSLLIQVRGLTAEQQRQSAIIRVAADGQNRALVAAGQFVGFTYP